MRVCLLALLPGLLCAQSLQEFEKKVTEFTLPNGMRFLIIERHEAPVVSFHTYVNVGSVDDPSGETGIAHMFEHMAFKGTPAIGSKNWPKEKAALAAIEAVYDKLDQEKSKGFRSDPKKIAELEAQVKDAIATADSFVEENEYDRIVESNGGVGMNASTGEDATNYFYSFPENRIELWFYLESERFLHPVFREFYKERDVVREERRMRVESSPQGKLVEALLATAIEAHPYRVMPGGWGSDIDNFRANEAALFYKKYYVAGNITIGIAGDVNPVEARKMAEKYFGRLPKAPLPPMVRTVEPKQEGPKRVAVETPAQPFVAIAYKRPSQYSPDDAALDVLSDILSGGRTGLIYKDLVRDKKVALGAGSQDTFPSGKYPSLFLFYVIPSTGHSQEENEKALYAIIEHVKKEKVDDATIARVRTKLRAALIRKLDSNSGLASELCDYSANFGDWKKLFTQLQEYDKVTADDVQRVAKTYLIEETRTVAYTQAPAEGAAK
jgi:predicted Zn-dependent peptidase